MEKATAPANPDAYVAALTGWRLDCVEALCTLVREDTALELREGTTIAPDTAHCLARKAVALNETLGDPTQAAKAK